MKYRKKDEDDIIGQNWQMDCQAQDFDSADRNSAADSIIFGMAKTKINYDLLSYLPEHLETVKGQDILVDEYGMGAFSMVVVEDMELKMYRNWKNNSAKYHTSKMFSGTMMLLTLLSL